MNRSAGRAEASDSPFPAKAGRLWFMGTKQSLLFDEIAASRAPRHDTWTLLPLPYPLPSTLFAFWTLASRNPYMSEVVVAASPKREADRAATAN